MGDAVVRDSEKAKADALRMAGMGIALIPIDPVDKRPFFDLLPKDEHGDPRWWPLRETPATPEKIEWWFWGGSDCNIAVITGQPSRLAVLDIDGPTPPDLPELPDTVVEKTPREEGGYHYYFRIDRPQRSRLYRWTDGDILYKCELKADLAYAICAPSSFGGKAYKWLPGHSIFEREPAMLPPGLVEYLERKHGEETSKRPKGKATRRGRTSTRKPARGSRDLRWYEELRYDEDVAVKIMRKCGADVVAVGDSFLCRLPGHEERHPSAALWYNEDGEIIFHDFHARDGLEVYSLANVYALCSTGKAMNFYNDDDWPWYNRWWARALHEAGCVDEPLPELAIKQELPTGSEGAPRNAKIVYAVACYIAQLEEWLYGKPRGRAGRKLEFTSIPVQVWAGMSPSTWTSGLNWFKENDGYLDVLDLTDLHSGKVLPSEAAGRAKSSRRQGTFIVLKPG